MSSIHNHNHHMYHHHPSHHSYRRRRNEHRGFGFIPVLFLFWAFFFLRDPLTLFFRSGIWPLFIILGIVFAIIAAVNRRNEQNARYENYNVEPLNSYSPKRVRQNVQTEQMGQNYQSQSYDHPSYTEKTTTQTKYCKYCGTKLQYDVINQNKSTNFVFCQYCGERNSL